MINLIEDWDALAEYADEKLGFFQLIVNDETFEVRVQTGKIGFKQEFQKNDPQLNRIIEFCKKHHYIKITELLRDEEFIK